MTTTDLRKKNFHIVVAPSSNGKAEGLLYIDDGVSLKQPKVTEIAFTYANGELKAKGQFGYNAGVKVAKVLFLGISSEPKGVKVTGGSFKGFKYDGSAKFVEVDVEIDIKGAFSVKLT